jgi:hypothetical protein
MPRIFVDSWAWLALYNENDNFHDLAVAAHEDLLEAEYVLVTSNAVLAETYTNLRRWASPAIAIRFGHALRRIAETGAVEIVHVTKEDERLAWDLFEKYDDLPDLSFNDCTSFSVMQRLGLTEAFTGDKDFRVLGFTIRP